MELRDLYLTLTQAARYLGCSRNKLIRLIEKGEIKDQKFGRHRVMNKKDLDQFKERFLHGSFHDTIIRAIINAIRMEFGYGGEEVIKECGIDKGNLILRVLVENVEREELRVPINEIRISQIEDAGYLGIKLKGIERINISEG
jgi:excisionase family DNA binding protein